MLQRIRYLLVTFAVALTACAATPSAPPSTAAAPVPAQETGATMADLGCPPPPPPGPVHSQPPPMYLNFGVRPENPSSEPGKAVTVTAYIKNVAKFPITIGAEAPALELRPWGAPPDSAPLWRFPLTKWAGTGIPPGVELAVDATWPGGDPGTYAVTFSHFPFTVACEHVSPTTGGGGTTIHVRMAAGQALTKSLRPKKEVTVHGITVRVDQIDMSADATQVTLWVSQLRAPAMLSADLLRDQSTTPMTGTGFVNRDAPGGVQVVATYEPTPTGTRSLTIQVKDIGLVTPGVGVQMDPGPWRIEVPLT